MVKYRCMSPCAIDPRVREVVMLRFRQTVQAALAQYGINYAVASLGNRMLTSPLTPCTVYSCTPFAKLSSIFISP